MPITLTPTPTPAATAYYTNQTQLEQKWGAENIRLWSNKGNDTLPTDVAAVQSSINLAGNTIDQTFYNGPFLTPLTPLGTMIVNWANVLAGYELYTDRGIFEKGDEVGGKLTKQRNDVIKEMLAYKGGAMTLQCQRKWPTPTGPIAV